jgi:hypothetical protein
MHLTWISLLLMIGAILLFKRQASQAGVAHFQQTGPLTALPDGITPIAGWASRLVVIAHVLWILLTALARLRHPPNL